MGRLIKNESCLVAHDDELDIKGYEEGKIYPVSGIKVEKGFYSLFELKRRYDARPRRIILDSDFQREDIWRRDNKAELVESVLMGLPLPVFYFDQDKYGRLIVVDGRQRLTAMFSYMNDDYKLNNLKILPGIEGRKFSDLSPVQRTQIEDFQIQAHVIMPPTPDRIKFDIFDRVNRGGMRLNRQEMRNALYQGEATRLIKRLAESEAFSSATGKAFIHENRMKDKYILTRFITFYLYQRKMLPDEKGSVYVYRDDIDEFLGIGMDVMNHMDKPAISEIETMVLECLKKSYYYLGEDGFRLSGGEKRPPINMNVFETVMNVMLYLPIEKVYPKEQVEDAVHKLIDTAEFRKNIGNHRDSAQQLKWRLEQAENIGRSFKIC